MGRDGRTTGPGSGNYGSGDVDGLRGARALDDESAPGLLGRLVDDITKLFRNELALARAETMEAAQRAKGGIGAVATGAGVLLLGALALVAAVILGLAEVMAPWLAALLVGVVLAVVGYVMVSSGKKRLEPSNFTLERTQESLRRDKDTVTHSVSGRTQ
jgi:hypothetical protein